MDRPTDRERDHTTPSVTIGCIYVRNNNNVIVMGVWWRWALVSLAGVAPSRMVSVSASVNLPLHHKVQKFSSGTGSPGWSGKKGRKMDLCVCGVVIVMSKERKKHTKTVGCWLIRTSRCFQHKLGHISPLK